jgi:outer membrane lipoprotein SlyB
MTVTERVMGVLALRPVVFEDIEADKHANMQALGIVVVGTLAVGLGGGQYGLGRMVLETIGAVVGLIIWAALTYLLGVRLLPEPQTRSDLGELLRVMGYATAPTVFAPLAAVPLVGRAVPFAVSFWLLGTFTIAVRQALDYRSTIRALVVVVVGWLFWVWMRDFGIPMLWSILF